jgi:hypothetical protein
MASQLEENIRNLATPDLLQRFYQSASEYSADARAVMVKEIERRGVSDEEKKPYSGVDEEEASIRHYSREDFVPFQDTFSQGDMLLVNSILHDADIPFILDNPMPPSVLPLEPESERRFTIHVLGEKATQAHESLDQHFHRADGRYHLRHTDVKDRLRRFGLDAIRPSEGELAEKVDAVFEPQEADAVALLGKRLLDEIEQVEQDRVVFYYDNVEDLLERLARERKASLTKLDLLTVIELLQIYCDDAQFPAYMEAAASALMDVFEA